MRKIISVFLLIFSTFALADTTPYRVIDRVQFNADSGAYFAYNADGWTVCDNTKYVQLRGSSANKPAFISLVLSSHMAQKQVEFSGSCTNSNGYLDAMYIRVKK